ncbi:hypothetical protein [uncultured Propionibacterium sp.]|uniref:hypothetical protein n=1 Tax=uncultured Propionibacterium sp. TaxID=218066 RepID=UPI002931482E|nr:hypothetical protein [uncultured Propionibacterium sp.]
MTDQVRSEAAAGVTTERQQGERRRTAAREGLRGQRIAATAMATSRPAQGFGMTNSSGPRLLTMACTT